MLKLFRKQASPLQPLAPLAGFSAPYQVHIGCNQTKIPGWVNMDVRATSATDLVHDCGNLEPFGDGTVETVFSCAFFEHLTFNARPILLREIYRALNDDGLLYFCGMPDFEIVARAYLEKRPGHVSPHFDLYEAYRYTHGSPEQEPQWWFEQLHKTLLDVPTVKTLLAKAGFQSMHVFRYAYGTEASPVCLNFMARRNGRSFGKDEVMSIIRRFAEFNRPNFDTLELGL